MGVMKKEDLRIVFYGYTRVAVATLDKLIEEQFNVVAVVTQPDKPVGRHGSVLQPSPVKTYACSKGIPVLQPVKNEKTKAFQEELRSYNADIQVVVAFRMLPESVWDMPPMAHLTCMHHFFRSIEELHHQLGDHKWREKDRCYYFFLRP